MGLGYFWLCWAQIPQNPYIPALYKVNLGLRDIDSALEKFGHIEEDLALSEDSSDDDEDLNVAAKELEKAILDLD